MMEVLTAIAAACVPLLATWITVHVIPRIKASTTAEQRRRLMQAVRSAVRAAEQVFKGKEGDGVNAEKLAYAKAHASADLKDAGEKVPDEHVLVGYIEAAVMEMQTKRDWGLDHFDDAMTQDAEDLVGSGDG